MEIAHLPGPTGVTGQKLALIAGGGGFIGGHLARTLSERGVQVRSVDIKPFDDWYQIPEGVEAHQLDLSELENCREAMRGIDTVYNLAADMGGMGFIETHKAECMLSVLINTHMLMAARDENVGRFFYSSSACVYAADKQVDADVAALKESDAYPAMPEDGYGWEKLFSERMCRHFREDFGVETRVARYHNVYGVEGTYDGGREKAPAALCRKIALAAITGRHEIEVWGDGEQTRSFMYVDDCTKGICDIYASNIDYPINLGSSELVTINQLVDIAEELAGVKLKRNYNLSAPKGVNGRNSDNTKILAELDWEPSIRLRDGLAQTMSWIEQQMLAGVTTR